VLILVLHALAVLRWPEAPWRPLLPAALGMSWSFHLSFTFLALSRPQSDIRPYGAAGAYPLILCVNLLTIWLGLAAAGSDTWFRDVHGLAAELAGAYLRAFELGWGVFIRLKNAIFEG
jgi:hypothetical protein